MVESTNKSGMYTREDESPDSFFYDEPRLEVHIDALTIDALTETYRNYLRPGDAILDLMSSWKSHLPAEIGYQSVTGLGMNETELSRNTSLDSYIVHDLNKQPQLPFGNGTFDAVLIAVSIQYLVKPVEVFRSIGQSLKPEGVCLVALSRRLFPSKAIRAFLVLKATERCQLVKSYFDYAGEFGEVEIYDRSPQQGDPLWIVMARKKADVVSIRHSGKMQ